MLKYKSLRINRCLPAIRRKSVSINIADYIFEGPFHLLNDLKDLPGVYAVLCIMEKNAYFVVDTGEAGEVKKMIETHERKECWNEHCKGSLSVAVLYTPDLEREGRSDIEKMIRLRDYVPCGNR